MTDLDETRPVFALNHHTTSRIKAAVLIMTGRFWVESPDKTPSKCKAPRRYCCSCPVAPSCPVSLFRGYTECRLFWDSGEAQMFSKDSIKGQGHPGHPPPTPPAHLGFWSPAPPETITAAKGGFIRSIYRAVSAPRDRASSERTRRSFGALSQP